MPLKLGKTRAQISGECTVEDAEGLFNWLSRHPACVLHFQGDATLHAAALQAIMAGGRAIARLSDDPFTAECLRQATITDQE